MRMRGHTWLERNEDMPMISSKKSEEYKMVEPGDIWGDSSDFLVYLSLFTCAWFADFKRKITLNPLRSITRYSFSASLPKKVECMLRRRCLFTVRAIFSKLVFASALRASLSSLLCNVRFCVGMWQWMKHGSITTHLKQKDQIGRASCRERV